MDEAHFGELTARIQREHCPRCGAGTPTYHLWDMPGFTEELESLMDSGAVVLEGCSVGDRMKAWTCCVCEYEWR